MKDLRHLYMRMYLMDIITYEKDIIKLITNNDYVPRLYEFKLRPK